MRLALKRMRRNVRHSHLGGDPTRHTAMGVGYGLERFAMLRYGIDDIRKIDVARVA